MRKLLAIGCCTVYLTFGLVAGAVHVHGEDGHQQKKSHLHLEHTHGPEGHHHPSDRGDDTQRFQQVDTGHHDGEALFVDVKAQRSLESNPFGPPAMISSGRAIEPPAGIAQRAAERPRRMRAPPDEQPAPARAPPA